MNKGGIAVFIRTFFFASSPVALAIIAKTGITPEDYMLYYNAALFLLPTVLVGGYEFYINWRNRPDVIVKKAEELSAVSKVVIVDGTNGKIGGMVANDDHPKIVDETTAKKSA